MFLLCTITKRLRIVGNQESISSRIVRLLIALWRGMLHRRVAGRRLDGSPKAFHRVRVELDIFEARGRFLGLHGKLVAPLAYQHTG
jgi:hypothetical protein